MEYKGHKNVSSQRIWVVFGIFEILLKSLPAATEIGVFSMPSIFDSEL